MTRAPDRNPARRMRRDGGNVGRTESSGPRASGRQGFCAPLRKGRFHGQSDLSVAGAARLAEWHGALGAGLVSGGACVSEAVWALLQGRWPKEVRTVDAFELSRA